MFAWILGLGAFFIALLATSSSGGSGITTANTLIAAIAVGAVWAGLALSYAIPKLPPSSAIIGLAAGAFVVAQVCAGRAFGRRPLKAAPTFSHHVD